MGRRDRIARQWMIGSSLLVEEDRIVVMDGSYKEATYYKLELLERDSRSLIATF